MNRQRLAEHGEEGRGRMRPVKRRRWSVLPRHNAVDRIDGKEVRVDWLMSDGASILPRRIRFTPVAVSADCQRRARGPSAPSSSERRCSRYPAKASLTSEAVARLRCGVSTQSGTSPQPAGGTAAPGRSCALELVGGEAGASAPAGNEPADASFTRSSASSGAAAGRPRHIVRTAPAEQSAWQPLGGAATWWRRPSAQRRRRGRRGGLRSWLP